MKAWQLRQWGEPEDLELVDAPMPEPGRGQVRLRVEAAALNFFDIIQVQGKYQVKPPMPFIAGNEVAGTIDAVGPGVSGWTAGDRAAGMINTGGFAGYCLANPLLLARIPDSIDAIQAAAMPVVYQTSYFALTVCAGLARGECLLVHGAAGGVGTAAVQLGKVLGAHVVATAGSDEKLAYCRQHGADHAIDYRGPEWVERVRELTGGRGADVVCDPVGGDVFDLSTRCIARQGRLLVVGFASGRIPSIQASRILLKAISVVGVYWGQYVLDHPDWFQQAQAQIFALHDAGALKPIVSRVYPFNDVVTALRDLAARRTTGKVVVVIS